MNIAWRVVAVLLLLLPWQLTLRRNTAPILLANMAATSANAAAAAQILFCFVSSLIVSTARSSCCSSFCF